MKNIVLILATLGALTVLASPAFAEDKDCTRFNTQQEAQAYLDQYKDSPKADEFIDDDMDDDMNGTACEDYDFKTGQYTGANQSSDDDDDDN